MHISYPTKASTTLPTFNTLRPGQNGCHFVYDIIECVFLYEYIWTLIEIALKFVQQLPINSIPALFQTISWPQQAIIWTNDGLVYWRIYTSLRLNELTTCYKNKLLCCRVRCDTLSIVYFGVDRMMNYLTRSDVQLCIVSCMLPMGTRTTKGKYFQLSYDMRGRNVNAEIMNGANQCKTFWLTWDFSLLPEHYSGNIWLK